MTDLIFKSFITLLLVIFILVFTAGLTVGIKDSQRRATECREKRGYPLMERGVFQDCLLGVKSIK